MYNLTDEQANVVKDVLKLIGQDDELNARFAAAVWMSTDKFNDVTDGAFIALGNGRLTVS
jgi:hypothetical protein